MKRTVIYNPMCIQIMQVSIPKNETQGMKSNVYTVNADIGIWYFTVTWWVLSQAWINTGVHPCTCIAHALRAIFWFKVHRSDFEVHQLPYVAFHKNLGKSKVPFWFLKYSTGELGYDRLNGTRKIGPSYAKSIIYIWQILDMHGTGTKHIKPPEIENRWFV